MNIYVGNISFETTENDIENAFGEYGNVVSVNIIKDRESGRSKGFGFVEMNDKNSGLDAIENLDRSSLGGRSLTVNEARPKQRNTRSW